MLTLTRLITKRATALINIKRKGVGDHAKQKNLFTGVLAVVLRLAAADRNDIELSAGGALSPWCGTGVGCVQHVQALANADSPEDLVIHHTADLKDQVQVLRVKEWWRGRRLWFGIRLLVTLRLPLRLRVGVAFRQLLLYQAGGELFIRSVAGTVCLSRAGRWCCCFNARRGVPIIWNCKHSTLREVRGELHGRNFLDVSSGGRVCCYGLPASFPLSQNQSPFKPLMSFPPGVSRVPSCSSAGSSPRSRHSENEDQCQDVSCASIPALLCELRIHSMSSGEADNSINDGCSH
jgi:hypothetical protein